MLPLAVVCNLGTAPSGQPWPPPPRRAPFGSPRPARSPASTRPRTGRNLGRLAGIGARQDQPDLVPDVVPEVVEGPAERRRVPRAAHEGVAVVVEGRVLRPHTISMGCCEPSMTAASVLRACG